MSDNIQTNTIGRLTPCLQKKIDKTTCLVGVNFSATSTQSVEDKLKRVILHDLEHGKQRKSRNNDECVLTSNNRINVYADYNQWCGDGEIYACNESDDAHGAEYLFIVGKYAVMHWICKRKPEIFQNRSNRG